MKNKLLVAIGVLVVLVVGIGGYMVLTRPAPVSEPIKNTASASPKDATYSIDGQPVTLVNGKSEVPAAPGSASKITTTYFGNEANGDLNGDSVPDVAFILTQSTGGSGTFYYVAAAIKTTDGYTGTDAVLLGDRIAPQTTEIKDGIVTANYADRKAGESFAIQPSVGKSLRLKLDAATMQFGIVAQNFEGEANPDVMTLGMQTWHWVHTTYANDTVVTPNKDKFTLTFSGKTFSAATDCNGVGGEYVVQGSSIAFTKMMSTLMFCEGSQETEYSKELGEVVGYKFTSKGELVLSLKLDSGSMLFR